MPRPVAAACVGAGARHRWFRVRRDTVELPGGRILDDYYLAVGEDSALVAAVVDDDELVLARQWKQGIGAVTLELAGGVAGGESPAEATARELLEETGHACAN